MNIKEFRNNFCKLAEGTESITVTKHNQIVGTYTPISRELCQRERFNQEKCLNTYDKEIKIGDLKFKVCNECLTKLKEEVQIEEV